MPNGLGHRRAAARFVCRDMGRNAHGLAHQLRLLLKMGEKLVQFGLNAFAHPGLHDGDQGAGQGQFAASAERFGGVGMAGQRTEFRGMQMGRKSGEQRR